jgi:hypothetical protein
MVWGWVVVSIFTMMVALSMAGKKNKNSKHMYICRSEN